MDTFASRGTLVVGGRSFVLYRLSALEKAGFAVAKLPVAVRILLESLLRREDGLVVDAEVIRAVANRERREIPFFPARVLLQDFTGVPAIVDLAAMADAIAEQGGDPNAVDPKIPVELVIDHSIQVDAYGTPSAHEVNLQLDYERNQERYAFLRWGRAAFPRLDVIPPSKGIVHQVNLEHLARVVFSDDRPESPHAYPDTLVGTDSHTPMVNGLGVLGWGVGGIEAEAAMLGQPIAMLVPEVIGLRLVGAPKPGVTATDVVLTVTETLRKKGVVGRIVEATGPGVATLSTADRATIANMSPEFGATATLFPVDAETLRYLRFTGRDERQVALVEAYCREQGLFVEPGFPEPDYDDVVEIDLATVVPSVAGPRRPQDRVPLPDVARVFKEALPSLSPANRPATVKNVAAVEGGVPVGVWGQASADVVERPDHQLRPQGLEDGSVVIAAITSCTNTSNPAVMLAAGLLARNAVRKGMRSKPWVKTSLAPGSPVVMRYLEAAGLKEPLEALGFSLVGFGCTTCIGNSGPLPEEIAREIADRELVVCAVLSGNRNFEGRIHADVRANWLMSPPLVVAYALAGRIDRDLTREPIGDGADGQPVHLADLWPSDDEIAAMQAQVQGEMFRQVYSTLRTGGPRWDALPAPTGEQYAWDPASTYVKRPPYFDGMPLEAAARIPDITGARALLWLGDSVTTDHISPAGSIHQNSPAGRWLREQGVQPKDFNSYGSRRGNHEVMVRGTFASSRIRNRLAPGTEGGVTTHLPSGEIHPVFDAAERYHADGVPLCVLAGREYGSGSSRDWAAKGPKLLGVRFVIAQSYERIHRSNLVGMGIVPLQFLDGQSADSLGLKGTEVFSVTGLDGRTARVRADDLEFDVTVRIDAPQEAEYVRHGGILPYVLRALRKGQDPKPKPAVTKQTVEPVEPKVEQGSIESFPASDPTSF